MPRPVTVEQQSRATGHGAGAPSGLAAPRRWVVYGFGSLLIAFSVYFGTYNYVVVQALIWAQTSLQRGAVVLLFFIVLANLGARRLLRNRCLSQTEMVALYGMLTIAGCAAGIGFTEFAVNVIAAPAYASRPGGSLDGKVMHHLPAWLVLQDRDAVMTFYRGQSTLYQAKWLAAWATPLLLWSAFLFAVFWVLLCVAALVRRHWIEQERLTFPLVELPLRMTDGGGGFWRSRPMWAGFVLAGLLESVNFLSWLYPSVPSLPLKPIGVNALDTTITTAPWNAMGTLRLAFYPWVIGLGFLLSLDVSFSCWLFYLATKAAYILTAVLGYAPGGGGPANRAPYVREQSLGAFVGLALFALWMGRREFHRSWSRARDTGDELISGRGAMAGAVAGIAGLTGFLVAAGVPLNAALVFVLVYLCLAITLARIVSEAGAGWAFAPGWTPTAFAAESIGPDRFSARQLVMLHGTTGWMGEMRDSPMPQQMQAAKLGHATGMPARALLGPLVWAAALAILAGFWAHLDIYYRFGAASAKVRSWPTSVGLGTWEAAVSAAASPTLQDRDGLIAGAFGAAFAIGLSHLRLQIAASPFHPLGYAVAMTSSMDYMWFPFCLAWIAKRCVVSFGGIRAYRAGVPFALGLILGDYVVPALWGLYGMTTGTQQYMVFPH